MTTPTSPRRLAQLPGYDTAPDVYETQQVSTSSPSSSPVSRSRESSVNDNSSTSSRHRSGSDSEASSSSAGARVSRRHLNPSNAREKFSISAKGLRSSRRTDLGDRVDGERRGYRIRRVTSGEDEDLDARIARLKREVEECRVLSQRKKDKDGTSKAQTSGADDEDEEEEDGVAEIEKLGKVLANLELPNPIPRKHTSRGSGRQNPSTSDTSDTSDNDASTKPEDLTTPQSLSKLSSFDTRLASIESQLGLSSTTSTTSSPLIPTLTLLDSQLSALSTVSALSNLESLSSRISSLRAEARKLAAENFSLLDHSNNSGSGGDPENEADGEVVPSDDDDDGEAGETRKMRGISLEDKTKLAELFALLPTLTSLSPVVPAVLARLKSLRALHSASAEAQATLDGIERRQEELGKGLRTWREGLQKIEEAVERAGEGNGRNGRMVKEWVDGLEGRVRALK